MDNAFDYASLCDTLEKLYRAFGVLPRVFGRTALGRALFALDLGRGRFRTLLLAGVSGADETAPLLLRFAETLLRHRKDRVPFCGVDLRRAFGDCGLTVVPCLNPDGLELNAHGLSSAGVLRRFLRPLLRADAPWHANAQGVDLRHQFSAGFDASRAAGQPAPGASGFGGDRPHSEAESHAITALCRKERFVRALLLQPGDRGLTVHAPQPEQAFSLADKLLAQELSVSPQRAGAPDGGFSFWFSDIFQRAAYTVQTGKGTDPLPEKMLFSCLLLSMLL